MAFPKKFLIMSLFISNIAVALDTDIKKSISLNKSDTNSEKVKKEGGIDCVSFCYRPISNEKTCEQYGTDSIGCVNYTRCLDKCEDNKKDKTKKILDNKI